jgi:hypothetical protein
VEFPKTTPAMLFPTLTQCDVATNCLLTVSSYLNEVVNGIFTAIFRSTVSGCCGWWHNQQPSQGDEFRLDLRPTNLQALHLRFEGVHRKSGISRSIPDENNRSLSGVVQKDLAIKIMHLGA